MKETLSHLNRLCSQPGDFVFLLQGHRLAFASSEAHVGQKRGTSRLSRVFLPGFPTNSVSGFGRGGRAVRRPQRHVFDELSMFPKNRSQFANEGFDFRFLSEFQFLAEFRDSFVWGLNLHARGFLWLEATAKRLSSPIQEPLYCPIHPSQNGCIAFGKEFCAFSAYTHAKTHPHRGRP